MSRFFKALGFASLLTGAVFGFGVLVAVAPELALGGLLVALVFGVSFAGAYWRGT
jgi:hypothetical protein